MTAGAAGSATVPPGRGRRVPSDVAAAEPGEPGLPLLPHERVRSICPYLGTGEGWRLAVADRSHRCLAVAPPIPLALTKQSRLCLDARHATCATFVAASTAAAAVRDVDEAARPVAGTFGSGRRWPVARTQSTVFDVGRGSVDIASVARQRTTGQVALVFLALVAFGALVLARVAADAPRPEDGVPVVLASATPVSTYSGVPASPTPSPTSAPSAMIASPSPTGPPASSTPFVPSPAPTRTYTVRSGDTLSAIAVRFGTTVRALRQANGITDPSRLQIGQVLQIPG
jgi:LysM repeat protein